MKVNKKSINHWQHKQHQIWLSCCGLWYIFFYFAVSFYLFIRHRSSSKAVSWVDIAAKFVIFWLWSSKCLNMHIGWCFLIVAFLTAALLVFLSNLILRSSAYALNHLRHPQLKLLHPTNILWCEHRNGGETSNSQPKVVGTEKKFLRLHFNVLNETIFQLDLQPHKLMQLYCICHSIFEVKLDLFSRLCS